PFGSNAIRERYRWGFSAGGHIAESNNDQSTSAMFPIHLGCERLTFRQHAAKSSYRPCVREVKMLKDFSARPLPRQAAFQLLGGEFGDRCGDFALQFREVRV